MFSFCFTLGGNVLVSTIASPKPIFLPDSSESEPGIFSLYERMQPVHSAAVLCSLACTRSPCIHMQNTPGPLTF